MILMKLPQQPDGSVPMRRIILKATGREVRPDSETGVVRAMTEAEAAELAREGWQRVGKFVDSEIIQKIFDAESARHGLVKRYEQVSDLELRRRADAAAFRKQAGYA